jgi:hypothetical protein
MSTSQYMAPDPESELANTDQPIRKSNGVDPLPQNVF